MIYFSRLEKKRDKSYILHVLVVSDASYTFDHQVFFQ